MKYTLPPTGWTRAVAACVTGLLTTGGVAVCTTSEGVEPVASIVEARSAPTFDSVIVAWNDLAIRIAVGEDQFLTFKGHRAAAMMHIAMHDALNTITPRFQRYAYRGAETAAHPTFAAAQAAYDVLLSQYASQKAKLDAMLAAWSDATPDDSSKVRAVRLGKAAAAAILSRRQGDGWDVQGEYEFRDAPGQYRTTPPWKGFVAQPGFRFAKPFGFASPGQFRPGRFPASGNEAYAAAFNEVKELGDTGSTRRTADQTASAIWWMEFPEGSVNRVTRELVRRDRAELWTSARLFALLGIVFFDVYVAVWDAKYEFNHWRPYTAIRRARSDGNAGTMPDSTWTSLRPAPPTPDYVSAHAAGCSSSFAMLRMAFGDTVRFTMSTTTAPPGMPTRDFSSFTAAENECADSRVLLGFHFRYSTNAGLALGRRLATHVAERHLRPIAQPGGANARTASIVSASSGRLSGR